MLGQTWKSEIREFKDEKTGRTIRQLTQNYNNNHLYFTENSFFKDSNQIVFRSDRASGEDKAPHEDPVYNLFSMDLETGEICQLTEETDSIGGTTKTPEGNLIVYCSGIGYEKRRDHHSLRRGREFQRWCALDQPEPSLYRIMPQ